MGEEKKIFMMPTYEEIRFVTRSAHIDKGEVFDLRPLQEGFYPNIPAIYKGQLMLLSVFKRSDGATVTLIGRKTRSKVVIIKHETVAKDAILGKEFFEIMMSGQNNALRAIQRPSGEK